MKVGLIRCVQTEDMCPATTDLKVMREKNHAQAMKDAVARKLGDSIKIIDYTY